MIGGILLIALTIVGLSWLFGYGRPDRFIKFIIWMIFGPLLLGLLYNEWLQFYSSLSPAVQVGSLLLVIPLVLFLARLLLPATPFTRAINEFIWDGVVFVITFPFRLVWRCCKQFASRERNRIRLQRYRPAVGGRPPLVGKNQADSHTHLG